MPTRRCAAQHRYGGAQLWLLVSRSLQPKRKRFRNDRWTAWIWCVPCLVAGGVLTGYIGISIEKVLFVLLTLSGKVPSAQGDRHIYHSRRLDLQNCLSHACDLTVRPARTVVHWRGPVPVGMPGILVGSIIGPHLNQLLGPRRLLMAFAAALLYESLRDGYNLVHKDLFGDCGHFGPSGELICTPQHESMQLGHQMTLLLPWLFSEDHLFYMQTQYRVDVKST
jgi:hypothetical protein